MRLLFILAIAAAFLISDSAYSQTTDDTPLSPVAEPPAEQLGLVLGIGQNMQSGSYLVDCEDCIFEGGVGFGWTIGAVYERELSDAFRYGMMLTFEGRNIESAFSENEPVNVMSEASGHEETVEVLFKHTGEVGSTSLAVLPFIKWLPSDYFFVKIGPTISYVLSANIKHTKELQQETVRLSTGEIYELSAADGGNSKVVEDGEFPDVSSLQLGISPIAGVNIPIGKSAALSFLYQHRIPFTEFSSKGDGFKISSWRVLVELRFALNETNNKK
jgi:hypothetical protein